MAGKKILVINTMCIGDLVLCTPLLSVLKNNSPQDYLAVLANKNNAEILMGNPWVDEIISLDKKGKEKGIAGMFSLIKKIRAAKFDLVVNLTTSERALGVTYLSGAKRIIGHAPFLKKHSGNVHKVEEHLSLLAKLNLADYKHNGLEVFPAIEAVKYIDDFLLSAQAKKLLIGLNPGASWPNKKWAPEKFAALADNLAKKDGVSVVFTGGKEDNPLVREIIGQMKTKPLDLSGKTNLQQLAALFKKCQLVITGDTGPLHIAVGVKTRVIGLFGPSSAAIYGPYGEGHTIIKKDLPCSPCNQNKSCPKQDCMKLIEVEEVLTAVNLGWSRSR